MKSKWSAPNASCVNELPLRICFGSMSSIMRSDCAMAHVSSLSSCPCTFTSVFGLRANMCSIAITSMPPVPAAGS